MFSPAIWSAGLARSSMAKKLISVRRSQFRETWFVSSQITASSEIAERRDSAKENVFGFGLLPRDCWRNSKTSEHEIVELFFRKVFWKPDAKIRPPLPFHLKSNASLNPELVFRKFTSLIRICRDVEMIADFRSRCGNVVFKLLRAWNFLVFKILQKCSPVINLCLDCKNTECSRFQRYFVAKVMHGKSLPARGCVSSHGNDLNLNDVTLGTTRRASDFVRSMISNKAVNKILAPRLIRLLLVSC